MEEEYVDDRHQVFKILLHEESYDPEEFIDNEEFLIKNNDITFKRQESFESPDELLTSTNVVSEIIDVVVKNEDISEIIDVVVKNEDVSEIIENVIDVVVKNEDVSEIIENVIDVVVKNEDVSEIIDVVVNANEQVDEVITDPVEMLKVLENKNVIIERVKTVEAEAQVLHTVRLDSFEEDQKNKKYIKNSSESVPNKKSMCIIF